MMPLEQLLSFPPSIEGRATVAIPENDRYPRLVRRGACYWILSGFYHNIRSIVPGSKVGSAERWRNDMIYIYK